MNKLLVVFLSLLFVVCMVEDIDVGNSIFVTNTDFQLSSTDVDDEENEVLERVARSPEAKPRVKSKTRSGSRSSSRYRRRRSSYHGGSSYRGGGSSYRGHNSTGISIQNSKIGITTFCGVIFTLLLTR